MVSVVRLGLRAYLAGEICPVHISEGQVLMPENIHTRGDRLILLCSTLGSLNLEKLI